MNAIQQIPLMANKYTSSTCNTADTNGKQIYTSFKYNTADTNGKQIYTSFKYNTLTFNTDITQYILNKTLATKHCISSKHSY